MYMLVPRKVWKREKAKQFNLAAILLNDEASTALPLEHVHSNIPLDTLVDGLNTHTHNDDIM